MTENKQMQCAIVIAVTKSTCILDEKAAGELAQSQLGTVKAEHDTEAPDHRAWDRPEGNES